MPAWPLGSPGTAEASIANRAECAGNSRGVWVLENGRGRPDTSMVAIAERLGVEFRRLPLSWNWCGAMAGVLPQGVLLGLQTALPLQGGVPGITLSSGRRGGAVAAWLKRTTGSRMVHYGACAAAPLVDLHIVDRDAVSSDPPSVLPILGAPHRLSPLALAGLRHAWAERLDHLPRPLLALVTGSGPFGAELRPSEAYRLARCLAAAAHNAAGAVLAVTSPGTGAEATDAIAAGLSDCLHLLYRIGEPGPEASQGFIASADAVVIAGNTPGILLQACASGVPVYIAAAGPLTGATRRLSQRLIAAGQVRLLSDSIESWRRPALDEAGRAADAIRTRCLLPG